MPVKNTVKMDAANKYIYFMKLDDEPKANKAIMIGLQGQTSGTNTRTLQTIQTKTVDVKMAGAVNQQRTVLVYFQAGDGIWGKLYHAWKDQIVVHLFRVDMNEVSGEEPNRKAPYEYAQCIIATLPQTETLNSVFQSSIQFEVQGIAQNGVITEDQLEEQAFDLGKALYDAIKPTEVGDGTATTTAPGSLDDKGTANQQKG